MEAWSLYLAVRVALNPPSAPHLILYQCINTSANSQRPLHAWMSYDIKFHTKAANDPTLRCDTRGLHLWLEYFPGTLSQSTHWPCTYFGSTTHYPAQCTFCSSPTKTHRGGQPPISSQQCSTSVIPNTCQDFNRSNCYCANCTFTHRFEACGWTPVSPHQGTSTLSKPLPWTLL